MNASPEKYVSTVYGPIPSWRVGDSLGIDLIRDNSVCSFNCVYCQLGYIQDITNQRREFVSTETVLNDFKESNWQQADIITYSGNGEPTLATNLGEVAVGIQAITEIPQLCLTNATTLGIPEVIEDLQHVDRVFVKVDAATEQVFQHVNRPAEGISLKKIVEDAVAFRKVYRGYLGVQCMFLPPNTKDAEALVELLKRIEPDEVQLNTPTRPYPKEWHFTTRGGHSKELREYESSPLKTISLEEAERIEAMLREKTGLKIVSVYQQSAASAPTA